jgi:hypothetical protein
VGHLLNRAGAAALARAARLSRRRMGGLRSPRGADRMLFGWLAVAAAVRFSENCALAFRELSRGASFAGSAITEFTMLHFLLAVFVLALLAVLLSPDMAGLDRKRLVSGGLGLSSLLPAALWLQLTRPAVLAAGLLLIPAGLPLALLARPFAAVSSLVLCFPAAFLAGAGVGAAVTGSRAAGRLSPALRLASAGLLIALVLSNFDFTWSAGSVQVFIFQRSHLLVDGQGGGILPVLRPWGPWTWIVEGRTGACAVLAAAGFATSGLAWAAWYRNGQRADVPRAAVPVPGARAAARPARRPAAPREQGRPGLAIYHHELLRHAFSAQGLLGAAAGTGFGIWLFLAPESSIAYALVGGILVLLAGFPAVVNAFGYDGGAMRRYAIAGTPWNAVFAAKNLAWLTVTAVSCLPSCAAAGFCLGPRIALSFLLSAAMVLLLSVCWGNLSSLIFPWARSLHRGAPREQPAFVNQAAPFLIAGIVLGIHRAVAPFGSPGFDAAVSACTAIAAGLWAVFLRRAGRSLDGELETVLERLRR